MFVFLRPTRQLKVAVKVNWSAGTPLDWIRLKLIGAGGIREAIKVFRNPILDLNWILLGFPGPPGGWGDLGDPMGPGIFFLPTKLDQNSNCFANPASPNQL